MEYEYITATDSQPPTRRELTIAQEVAARMCTVLANDLDAHRSKPEQHTAALLRLCSDAVERGYEADLVRLARSWRREVESGGE